MSSRHDELASLLASVRRDWSVEGGDHGVKYRGRPLESVQAEQVLGWLGQQDQSSDDVVVKRSDMAVILQYATHALRAGGFGARPDSGLVLAINDLSERMRQ